MLLVGLEYEYINPQKNSWKPGRTEIVYFIVEY